jgi:hypothetical protein
LAELKTKPTGKSVDEFLDSIQNEQVRDDCRTIAGMMEKATKSKPRMWGPSIVGFGSCVYRYPNGREMDWMVVAFSPRKQNITLYLMPEFAEREELLGRLGKHSCSVACIYVKRLSDVHLPTLKKLIEASVRHTLKTTRAASATASRSV